MVRAAPSTREHEDAGRPRVPVAVVADRDTTRLALVELLEADPEFDVVGCAEDPVAGRRILDEPELRVILVNLSLSGEPGNEPGLAFIRLSKSLRPDVGIVSLKRDVDEHRLRAATPEPTLAAWRRPPKRASSTRLEP